MSVVLNDKPRQSTLKWRWPLSRQLTLSVATLAVLAVWWAVAALQLISPLFLPPPGRAAEAYHHRRATGLYGCDALAAPAASLTRIVIALLAAVLIGVPVGSPWGSTRRCAGSSTR